MRMSFFDARTHVLRALLVLMAVTLVSGCGIFSPEDTDGDRPIDPPEPWQLSTTPDRLAENFERVWAERNIDQYDLMLAEDFVFYVWAGDVNDEQPETFWDRATELQTAEFMFGTPPDPSLTVVSIEFTRFEVVEPWDEEVSNPELADADFFGTYRVQLSVAFTDETQTVQGQQRLYIKRVTKEIDGEDVEVYVLRAWEDLGTALF